MVLQAAPVVSMHCSMFGACAAHPAGLDRRTLQYVPQHSEHHLQQSLRD